MELQEFIRATIESIINGVKEANKNLGGENGVRLRPGKDGEFLFDIAITVSQESKKSGGAGVKVYALNVGGEKGSSVTHENISRVKFKIEPDKYIA